MRTLLFASRIGVMLIAALVVFALFIQCLALGGWSLSEASTRSLEDLATLSKSSDRDRQPVGHHKVAEWPAENGRHFQEAPQLRALVEAGKLPPVAERLPEDPLVIVPPQQMGPYGGTWTRYSNSVRDVSQVYRHRLTYDSFLRYSPMGDELLPNLAKSWEIHDDGRVYILHLRHGVRWSDGYPFTSEDVMFWYEDMLLNKELSRSIKPELQSGGEVVKLTAPDDYTLRFEFKEPSGLFLPILATRLSDGLLNPKHYLMQFHADYAELEAGETRVPGQAPRKLQRMVEAAGFTKWTQLFSSKNGWENPDCPTLRAWMVNRPPPNRPIGTVRNPYYWKVDPEGRQLPYIDEVVFEIYNDDIMIMRALAGQMEMQGRNVRFEDIPLLMKNRDTGHYTVRRWVTGAGSLAVIAPNLNYEDPTLRALFEDRRFRIALSYAIDRDMINEARYLGQAEPRQVAPSVRSRYYDSAFESAYTEYAPEKAIALLEEIGLKRRASDGLWLRPDNGKPILLRLDVTEIPNGAEQIVDLIADAWTAIGLDTDVNRMAKALWTQRRTAGQNQIMVWSGENEDQPLLDPRWYLPYNSTSLQAVQNARWVATGGEAGVEPTGDLRRVIDLYDAIGRTADDAKQMRLMHEILEINRYNLWTIGTVGHAPIPFVVHNDMKNVPDVAVESYYFRSPGHTAPECYALDRGP